MADIFLSYSREDQARARTIATALSAAGFNVFWDTEIPPGKSWADVLEQKLSESKAAIVLWSKTSVASQWVREEARMARDRGKLLPILIEECSPPFGFGEIQAADLTNWRGDVTDHNWHLLLKGIENAVTPSADQRPLDRSPFVSRFPPQRLPKMRWAQGSVRILILGAVVTAIGAVAFVGWRLDHLGGSNPASTRTADATTTPVTPAPPDPAPTPPNSGERSTDQTNYANELTDFGVPPQAHLQRNVGTHTPTSIPGGRVVMTSELREQGRSLLLVDVLEGPQHPTIPGAVRMPGMGNYGSFDDDIQQNFESQLAVATGGNRDRWIVFFCQGSSCWESYNAVLRAQRLGYKRVGWYRGGLSAWSAAGLPLG